MHTQEIESQSGTKVALVVALVAAVVVTCAALVHAYGKMRFYW